RAAGQLASAPRASAPSAAPPDAAPGAATGRPPSSGPYGHFVRLPGPDGPCYGATGRGRMWSGRTAPSGVSSPANPAGACLLRNGAAAALAVPVRAILYLPVLARRPIAARLALVASVGIVVLVSAFGLSRPTPTQAVPPAPPIRALPDDAFQSIGAATDLHAAVDIT